MNHLTPAQLSLELGVTSHDVRTVLRDSSGAPLEQGADATAQQLTDEQVRTVRSYFPNGQRNPSVWSLEPGETVRRTELQATYRGSRQDGIVPSSVTSDILAFTNPVKGAAYGYDRFEGLHPDGTYTYTGAGATGDQEFVRGNKALRDAAAAGRTIRLFVSKGVNVTYAGAFTTGDPAYSMEQIPDVNGNLRRGIIFNFIPLGQLDSQLPIFNEKEQTARPVLDDWTPPDDSDIALTDSDDAYVAEDHVITRVEHRLQVAFGSWLGTIGLTPKSLKLPTSAGLVEPDFFVDQKGWIVEAKKSTARVYVRMAIGQVLDYVHLATKYGIAARPVILLPGRPEPDLQDLMASLGIKIVVRSDSGFEIIEPQEMRAR